jgi:energy-coupling factor transport system ATP-binding protein
MTNDKITLENVSYVYGAGTPYEMRALDSVSLGIRAGTITGIIGHTGSGKSTMVQLFNGLEKPMGGRILLDGEDIWAKPKEIRKIRFRVGLVMQYPEYQLFEETVRADIAYGPRNMGLDEAEIAEAVRAEVNTMNKQLVGYKQVRAVEIRRTEFEKTTTRKIKRHLVK